MSTNDETQKKKIIISSFGGVEDFLQVNPMISSF